MDWGADYIPLAAWAQAAILGGANTITSILVSKVADVRVGAGIAGGGAALLMNRIRQIIATSGTAPAQSSASSESSAVVRGEAGAVRRQAMGAGQMRRRTGAPAMRRPELGPPGFRQGMGVFDVQGRRFGPGSWVYGAPAGAQAVYVSAHNLPRNR
jgi:hypothetical protein